MEPWIAAHLDGRRHALTGRFGRAIARPRGPLALACGTASAARQGDRSRPPGEVCAGGLVSPRSIAAPAAWLPAPACHRRFFSLLLVWRCLEGLLNAPGLAGARAGCAGAFAVLSPPRPRSRVLSLANECGGCLAVSRTAGMRRARPRALGQAGRPLLARGSPPGPHAAVPCHVSNLTPVGGGRSRNAPLPTNCPCPRSKTSRPSSSRSSTPSATSSSPRMRSRTSTRSGTRCPSAP